MKIIIPMAGRGTRLRPHTLTVPKPLLKIAGKSIVERLVEDLVKVCGQKVEEIAFIIGDFGDQVEKDLIATAERQGAKGSIYYQKEQLGTAHALLCAADSFTGNVLIAFADTLFKTDTILDTSKDGVIWVKKVENPSAYGVVTLNQDESIAELVEKPAHFVSDLAIIGIYYFRDGDALKHEMQYLLDNKIATKGEYQLTDALDNMRKKGAKFYTSTIDEWLDFGNKDLVVESHGKVLQFIKNEKLVSDKAIIINSTIIEPCYIADDVKIENSVIGPLVSIGAGSSVCNAVITNSILQEKNKIENIVLENSMLGSHVDFIGKKYELSIGDYSKHI